MHMISIITPTYNRAKRLQKVFDSLASQEAFNFEWVIIDDGSTDDTQNYIRKVIQNSPFEIRSYYQKNSGKMQAYNRGVKESRGDYILCLDSDDYLTVDAISRINNALKTGSSNETVGFVGLKKYSDDSLTGTPFPKGVKTTTLQDLYNRHRFKGETVLIYKMKFAKKHYFPKIDGEKFITEAYLYDQLDLCGNLGIINSAFYVCEYLDDGYTRNADSLLFNNPKGFMVYNAQRIRLASTMRAKCKAIIKYNISKHINKDTSFSVEIMHRDIVLCTIAYPMSIVIYLIRYKLRSKI